METTGTSAWDFGGGRLPLDFANTVEWHASAQPQERLGSYADLVSWSKEAGLLTESEAQRLLADGENHPSRASAALGKAIKLREAIYRIYSAVAGGEEPKLGDITMLNQALKEALAQTQIVPTSSGFELGWVAEGESFDRMLWPIARSAAELLTSQEFDRVGQCADDRGCGYLFFDTSRNRKRRWCSMESCGNRAKAQRHYQRSTQKR